MWNPFKKKDPLEGQRANYSLAFDIVPHPLEPQSETYVSALHDI